MKLNKYLYIIVFALAGLSSIQVSAQGDIISQVKETIKAGSAKELSKYLNQTVDVTLDDGPQSYSKAQAEFVFQGLF